MTHSVRKIRFSLRAEENIRSIYNWYQEKRYGLGSRFVLALEAKLATIQKHHELFPVAVKRYRKAQIKRFPFAIWYEITAEEILILIVRHSSREAPSLP